MIKKTLDYFAKETAVTTVMTNFQRWKLALCQGVGEVIVFFIPFTVIGIILINYLKRHG